MYTQKIKDVKKQLAQFETLLNAGDFKDILTGRSYEVITDGMPRILVVLAPKAEGGVLYFAQDVERSLGLKRPGALTRRHFKALRPQVLVTPHPINSNRCQFCNYLDAEGVRKLCQHLENHLPACRLNRCLKWLLSEIPALIKQIEAV